MTTNEPGSAHRDPADAGPAAWRVAAQVVAGVGQVLLWILTGIGRLLRPITTRLVGALYGKTPPPQGNPATRLDGPQGGTRVLGGNAMGGPYGGAQRPGAPHTGGQPGAAQGAGGHGPGGAYTSGSARGAYAGNQSHGVGGAYAGGAAGVRRAADGTALLGAVPQVASGKKAPPVLRWLHAWRRFGESWAYAPVTGALLTLAALAELPMHHLGVVSLPGGFALASTAPLMFRRDALRPVAAIVLGALAASLLSGQPLLATTALAGLGTLFLLAQHLPRQSAGVLGVCGVAAIGVVYLASNSLNDIPWLAGVVAVLAAVGLGDARRVAETAEASVDEERERNTETLTQLNNVQREQAILRERARIARELHDVVAHSVSMIAVQAETAPYTMHALSPEATKGFSEIAGSAREALDEMRRLLTVLRADQQAEPEVNPQPRLDRLPELIDLHRGSGGQAQLTVHGEARPLSTTIELSAYRIVQEALTNARRHAPGSRVRVELDYLADRLAVRVADDGSTQPPPADATRVMGHGLVGMRERATMLGGRFTAGPQTRGGFAVEAELPVGQNLRT